MKNTIEITKGSGEVVLIEDYATELIAQEAFDELEKVRYPMTYKGLTMNLSEYRSSMDEGSVRLVIISSAGERYVRRELFRKP